MDPRLPPWRVRGARSPAAGLRRAHRPSARAWRSRSSTSGRSGPRRRSVRSCSPPARRRSGSADVADASRARGAERPRRRPQPGKVYGRFEATVRNELWTGDGLHGPTLAGAAARRAVLLAFIDDHSRLLVGWRWGTGEDVFRLEAALRSGLMARGVPERDPGRSRLARSCPRSCSERAPCWASG